VWKYNAFLVASPRYEGGGAVISKLSAPNHTVQSFSFNFFFEIDSLTEEIYNAGTGFVHNNIWYIFGGNSARLISQAYSGTWNQGPAAFGTASENIGNCIVLVCFYIFYKGVKFVSSHSQQKFLSSFFRHTNSTILE
jgi:hypothetical protein